MPSEKECAGLAGSTIRGFVLRLVLGLILITLVILLWYAADVLLLTFAGILLAILLRSLANALGKQTGLSCRWSLVVVLLAGIGLAVLAGFVIVPRIGAQVDELSQRLPQAFRQLREQAEATGWGRRLLSLDLAPPGTLLQRPDLLAKTTGVVSTTFGAIAGLIVISIVGLYLAWEPRTYVDGIVVLVPPDRRERAREVLDALGVTLRWWVFGRLVSMSAIGVLTWIGLWLLDIPLALTLAILSALLTFIPNFGPILSVFPPALLAMLQSPAHVMYVVLLYIGVQLVESYLVTPVVQRQMVALPPALTIVGQVLLGVLAGILGLALASPLIAAAMVLMRMLYVEDALGDRGSAECGVRSAE
jgi:predicted PurR-regulated permease PerM